MRKLLFIMAGFVLVISLTSCEKQNTKPNDKVVGNDAITKSQPTDFEPYASKPVVNLVTPYVIPGENRGGNRTCEDAQAAFDLIEAFENANLGEITDCGEKVDIDEYFEGDPDDPTLMYIGDKFPGFSDEGVWVNDDGTIGFDVGGSNCIVRAVIVKGSNQANVYYYPDGGTLGEDGLAAPAFDDGRIPWVSNVTFCCEAKIFAAKVYYYESKDGDVFYGRDYALSVGGALYTSGWCDDLGFNYYPDDDEVKLGAVGAITIDEFGNIIITMDEYATGMPYLIDQASVFVGIADDLIDHTAGCPKYWTTPWVVHSGVDSDTDTFLPSEF